jgi:hypothetical protein
MLTLDDICRHPARGLPPFARQGNVAAFNAEPGCSVADQVQMDRNG